MVFQSEVRNRRQLWSDRFGSRIIVTLLTSDARWLERHWLWFFPTRHLQNCPLQQTPSRLKHIPVPNSKLNSVLSQSLIQVTFCTEFVWFRAKSVNHFLNYLLIQKNTEYSLWILLWFREIQKSLHNWFWNPSESALNHGYAILVSRFLSPIHLTSNHLTPIYSPPVSFNPSIF